MKKIPVYKFDEIVDYTIVDDEDFEFLSQSKWGLSTSGYAHTGKSNLTMHRLIMDEPISGEVDHINGNKLDNRRKNLRVCSRVQNEINKPVRKKSKSGLKGVYKLRKKWAVCIKFNGYAKYLGSFDSKEEAARAYNDKAVQLYGEYAWLNPV